MNAKKKQHDRKRPEAGRPPMYGPRKHVSILIEEDLLKRLDKWAERNGMSRIAASHEILEGFLRK